MLRLPFTIKDVPSEKSGKPFKNIRFLGKSWFEKVLNTEEDTIDRQVHLSEAAFLTDFPVKTVFKSEVMQRVTIPPDYVRDPTPFYTERLYFGEQAGLYALVQWIDDGVEDLFRQSFRLLGDLGIGTDRSVGNGFFEPSFTALELNTPASATHQCTLGLYLPGEGELTTEDLEASAWSITKRGGYMAGASNPEHITLRKRSVFMFEAGSVFPNKPLAGKRVDLKPDWQGLEHAVWRDGRSIFVPVNKILLASSHEY
jgi:CRISPR-associated protein Csm4